MMKRATRKQIFMSMIIDNRESGIRKAMKVKTVC